nr:BTAD domain-containing putative transcriptional regulator [Motilibacter deserti]
MQVCLLGPVRAVRGDEALALGGPRPRALVARLALSAGGSVPVETLVAALWDPPGPPSALSTLRAYVSRLRGGPLNGLLESASGGYALRVDRAAVDLLAVQGLLRAARAAASDPAPERSERALLEAALALCTGPPLSDVQDAPFAREAAAAFAEPYISAQERLAELQLRAGEHQAAIESLSALVAAHPLREGPAVLLATALARTGRVPDSLDVLDTLRHTLADELGLDPTPQVLRLRQALLVHDPVVLGLARPDAVAPDAAVPQAAAPRLPLPLTRFVGRSSEIAQVHAALDTARLVTLVGPGGSGKTRLSLEALRRAELGTAQPTLVELAELQDPGLVAAAVAQALDISTREGDVEPLVASLAGRRALLLLDNAEHVIDAVAQLTATLLSRCPGLQLLVTSREALGVPGERVVPVPPMRLGASSEAGEAEALFADRASLAAPGFTLDEQTLPAVRRLCAALDGIPLALELAAARLAVLSLDDIAGLLDDRFTLLADNGRATPARHRTLRSAVEWSYGLLDDQERELFTATGVFAGPFGLDALRGVCEPELGFDVLGPLSRLAAKSMIEVSGGVDAPRRYRLLDTLRTFAQEQLPADRGDRLAEAHTEWYAALVDAIEPELRREGLRAAHARLDQERADLRAALTRALERGQRTQALRLAGGQAWHWLRRGNLVEGMRWTDAARALPGRAPADVETRATMGAAILAYMAGDTQRLHALGEAGAAQAAEAGDASAGAVAHGYCGYWESLFGELERAPFHFAEAQRLFADAEPWARSKVLMTRGQYLRAQGRHAEALTVLAEAAAEGARCGDVWAVGSARWVAAKVHLDLNDGRSALRLLLAACTDTYFDSDITSTLAGLHVAAAALAMLERHVEGARLLGAVDALGERYGYSAVRMDPVDGPACVDRVREGLTPRVWASAYDSGRGMSVEALLDLLRDVARATRVLPVAATG